MKITRRNDVSPKSGIHKYGNVKFADPTNHKYPLDTEEHIRSAWGYIGHSENASKYSPAEVTAIKRRIVSAWRSTINKAGPESATSAEKSVQDNFFHWYFGGRLG